ncbi:MAG: hypothetical protein OIF40_13565 [Mangrovicoccus sp.]|nr:hypothetical protein [Mangrovicoccus sp.]
MESLVSTVLSVLNIGKRSVRAASVKRHTADQLNTELEMLLIKSKTFLEIEHAHLLDRISVHFEHAPELLFTIHEFAANKANQLEVGFTTAKNSREKIKSSSLFAPLSEWDEAISILLRQKAAAELQLEQLQMIVAKFHRILDDAA